MSSIDWTMVKFTTIFRVTIWILLAIIIILAILSAFFCIQQQVSNWTVGPNWAIGDNWDVASTTVLKPLDLGQPIDFFRQILESLKKESNIIFPCSLAFLIIAAIIKLRERIIRAKVT
jgi:hypothetical protein